MILRHMEVTERPVNMTKLSENMNQLTKWRFSRNSFLGDKIFFKAHISYSIQYICLILSERVHHKLN